jgi:hypothetical protein
MGDAYFSFTRQPKGVSRPVHAEESEPAGVWANGAEVWATGACCPYGREAICTVCPHKGGAARLIKSRGFRDRMGELAGFRDVAPREIFSGTLSYSVR